MPNVLIRDLDPQVHATLTARAEREGRSLQQYLSQELAKLAAQPTLAELLDEISARDDNPSLTVEQIVDAIQRGREREQ